MATVLNALVRRGYAQQTKRVAAAANWDRYATLFSMVAARVGVNRTVAGVHYPVDTAAGATLGVALGQYMLSRCGAAQLEADGTIKMNGGKPVPVEFSGWEFDGWAYNGRDDFERQLQIDVATGDVVLKDNVRTPTPLNQASFHPQIDGPFQQKIAHSTATAETSDFLEEMFKRATKEWLL